MHLLWRGFLPSETSNNRQSAKQQFNQMPLIKETNPVSEDGALPSYRSESQLQSFSFLQSFAHQMWEAASELQ